MAKFNPDIPTNAPPPESYLNATRPLSSWDIGVDHTGQVALTGIADVFKNAVTGADEVIKSMIDTGLRKSASAERDVSTGALEGMAGIPDNQRISPYQSTPVSGEDIGANKIIPGSVAQPVPSALQPVESALSGANTGLLTKPGMEAYYSGKLDTIARSYRSQFPGYADYIDQRMEAITGQNPANKYREELTAMVAATQSNYKVELEKALSHAMTSQQPGAADIIRKIRTPGSPESKDPLLAVAAWEAPWKQKQADVQNTKEFNDNFKGTNDVQVIQNRQKLSPILDNINNTMFKQVLGGVNMTVEDLQNAAYDYVSGKKTMTPEQANQNAQAINIVGQQVRMQMEDALVKSGASTILPDGGKSLVDEKTARYGQLAKMFSDKDLGPAHEYARQIALSGDMATNWLMTHDPNKWYYQLYIGASKNGGPGVAGMLSSFSLGTGMVDQTLDGYKKFSTLQLANPWDQNGNVNLESVLDNMRGKGVGDPKDPAKKSQNESYKYFTTDLPGFVADTKFAAPMRATLASNIFQGNIVNKFASDYTDDKGVLHPGKRSVFNSMTSDNIRDAVWNLAGSNAQSPLWLQYKNWVARQTYDLTSEDTHTVNELLSNPSIKLTYDDKTQRIGSVNTDSNKNSFFMGLWPNDPMRRAQENNLANKVNSINQSLAPSIAIVKKEGGDVNAYVMQKMQDLGLDPRKVFNATDPTKPLGQEEKKAGSAPSSGVLDNVGGSLMNMLPKGAQDYVKKVATEPYQVPFASSLHTATGVIGSALSKAQDIIKNKLESGGNYNLVGIDVVDKKTGKVDNAYGAYGVMGKNVGPWTEQYYGKRLTPQEFLKNKDAQDAVFHGEFGRLMTKHGAEGAARAWYAGEGGMNNLNATDAYRKLTVGGYGKKFSQSFNQE